jgi:ABC-2 type transport system ATP-binding protein
MAGRDGREQGDALCAEGLTKRYGATLAVDNLSLKVRQGEVYGFLGPNGAGKTTTIRLALGLHRPSSGRATIFGIDAWRDPVAAHRRVAYVAGEPALWPQLTGAETLEFLGRMHGDVDAAYRAALIKRFDLEPNKKVRALSKGNRQKLQLIAAFATRADLLILDEPTSGLDPLQIIEMRSLIRNLRGAHTILLSSHILSEISQTCDRLLVIQDGEIVAQGTEQELAARMGAGGSVEVEVAAAAGRRVVDLASTVPGVSSASIVREADGVVLVRMQAPADLRPKIARVLVNGGLDLLRIDRGAAQLESIFLQLTKTHTGELPQ